MSVFVIVGALLALLTLALLTRPLWRRPSESASSKGLLVGLVVFVGAITVAGYAWIGTPRALDSAARAAAAPAASAAPDGASAQITTAQIEGMVALLDARVKERPEDAEGWAMLGRANALLDRHALAAPAFKQAMTLRPDDANLVADYADALAMASGRSLEGEPSRLIDRALKLDPQNLKALSLAGTVAFSRQDYAGAIGHWEKMAQLAGNGEGALQIQSGIAEARRRMAVAAAPVAGQVAATASSGAKATATATASASAPGASLRGTVTLAPTLAAQARPDDTLFVFARSADGPRMPLAILRKRVKDLPLDFVLDDSSAMSPAARLSSAQRVVVGARVSRSGDAMPQPGDLQGWSAAVAPGASGLMIEIREVVGR